MNWHSLQEPSFHSSIYDAFVLTLDVMTPAFWGFLEKLFRLLDVWLVTIFYLNSYETPFSAWNNFITWELRFFFFTVA